MGADYFVADPLGLMAVTAAHGEPRILAIRKFRFDVGIEGNRFFSKDHKALLIIAEPREPVVDYRFAEQVVQWTHAQQIQTIERGPERCASAGVRAVPAGAYVYAEAGS
jgi:hypothetical protein